MTRRGHQWLVPLLLTAVCPRHVEGQTPNTLVSVELIGAGEVTVEAVLTADSVLLLPAGDVAALLGLPTPPAPWITLAELRGRFPPVQITWDPRRLTVVIRDDLAVLPASRARRDQVTRRARGAPGVLVTQSGPFFSLTASDVGRQLWEGGYSYRGRAAVSGRVSRRGASWTVSLVPAPQLFITYAQGQAQPAQLTGHLAVGPVWLAPAWTVGHPVGLDALVAAGPVALFASSRNTYAITIRGPVTVQAGRTGKRTTGRVAVGPVPPSPFNVPAVP